MRDKKHLYPGFEPDILCRHWPITNNIPYSVYSDIVLEVLTYQVNLTYENRIQKITIIKMKNANIKNERKKKLRKFENYKNEK